MSSWSFCGSILECEPPNEIRDYAPESESVKNYKLSELSKTTNLRQSSEIRTAIYNNLFSTSNKAFADVNPNWALSTDTLRSSVVF